MSVSSILPWKKLMDLHSSLRISCTSVKFCSFVVLGQAIPERIVSYIT